ncbi:MAG: hypothetical protein PVF45_02840 [Anaerolineae bacterium]|jgi:hypothetical protein
MSPAYTDEQLLQILRDLAAELGYSPTVSTLRARPDLPTHVTYANRFGSWTSALKAAGLEPYRLRPTFSKEQLLQILRDLAAELGYAPTTYEMQARQDLPSPATYHRHFGTWKAALQAAGLTPGRRPPAHTDEQLLQILRDLAAELGRSPTQRELQARDDLPLLSVYCRHFGGWNAALEAAGLKLNRAKTVQRKDANKIK